MGIEEHSEFFQNFKVKKTNKRENLSFFNDIFLLAIRTIGDFKGEQLRRRNSFDRRFDSHRKIDSINVIRITLSRSKY